MSTLALWLTIFGMVAVTFSTRLSVIALLGDAELPPNIRRALRFVPPAVLTAIIFPEILKPGGTLDLTLGNARLLAGIGAAVVAYFSKKTLLAIAVGMGLLWILQAVLN